VQLEQQWINNAARSRTERDSQRSKVYAAERMAFDGHPVDYPEMKDVLRCVAHVLKSARVKRSFPILFERDFVIKDGRRARSATGWASGMSFPREMRKRWVILHELAHVIHQREEQALRFDAEMTQLRARKGFFQSHGWRWAEVYLKLVLWFMGRPAYDALRKAFKAGRVRHRPPRLMSPEQRAAAAERLKKVRVNAEFFRRAA